VYRSIDDFVKGWQHDSATTLRVLRALTDASLDQRIHDGGRTLGRLAWHVAETIPEMMGHAGVTVPGPGQRIDTPTSAAEIVGAYERAARALPAALRAAWTDGELGDEVAMYGQTWTKAMILTSLHLHEVHHRGQMTVLMRQAGLVVPGCYGPAAEEWAAMGMPALA
jgi:uncharacterized damage-inducible protein DinB